ncbi:DUF1398 family protein [Carnobacterium sp.]
MSLNKQEIEKAGVPFWTSDLVLKQVIYYDTNHKALLVEPIPGL